MIALHQHAQRLLRPLSVVNAYAPELTFLDTQIRTRRDHEKYLTLIDAIALLHQHQRPVKRAQVDDRPVEYVEVELGDLETANRLAHEVLGRSLDELPPQTRRLLGLLDQMVAEACTRLEMARGDYRFSRREVRESTGWGNSQLKLHLARLVDLEYLALHPDRVHAQRHVYELVYEEPTDGRLWHLPGLIDVEKLRYDTNRPGSEVDRPAETEPRPAPGRPPAGAWPAPSRIEDRSLESVTSDENPSLPKKNAHPGSVEKAASHRTFARRSTLSLAAGSGG